MAYGRRFRYRRRRYPGRRYARRSIRTARFSRRTPFRRRSNKMTTRRVRNLAARKCRDNMLSTPKNDAGDVMPAAPYEMEGGTSYRFLFSPSFRSVGSIIGPEQRQISASWSERWKTKCFMRGYKETVELETNDSSSWLWRRIVFTCLGWGPPLAEHIAANVTQRGYGRLMYNLDNGQHDVLLGQAYSRLFEGQRTVDWVNPLTAKVDSRRVRVISDTLRTIQSPNSGSGRYQVTKRWYPVNRSIIYDDDERGSEHKFSVGWASGAEKGNSGDLFVFDMFDSASDAEPTSTLAMGVSGTYYWHEGAGR